MASIEKGHTEGALFESFGNPLIPCPAPVAMARQGAREMAIDRNFLGVICEDTLMPTIRSTFPPPLATGQSTGSQTRFAFEPDFVIAGDSGFNADAGPIAEFDLEIWPIFLSAEAAANRPVFPATHAADPFARRVDPALRDPSLRHNAITPAPRRSPGSQGHLGLLLYFLYWLQKNSRSDRLQQGACDGRV